MQSGQQFYPKKVVTPLACEVGGHALNITAVPALDPTLAGAKHVGPFPGVEIQASEMCPKNFIIVDQTDKKSRIMFHPAMAGKLNCSGFDIHATYVQENFGGKGQDEDNKSFSRKEDKDSKSSSLKEDTEDIDALMSLEEEEDEDEEVSTGRTMGDCRSSSPDSSSTNSSKSCNIRSSSQKSLSCSTSSNRKKRRMQKMMKALRGIVPGGEHMDTAMVLDEAVRYLKSLKVEVKKLGIGNFKKN